MPADHDSPQKKPVVLDLKRTGFIAFVNGFFDTLEDPSPLEIERACVAMRERVLSVTVPGMSEEEVLRELDSTVSRQMVFRGWHGREGESGVPDEEKMKPGREPDPFAPGFFLRVRGLFRAVPARPPGPDPGGATGPCSDATPYEYRANWRGREVDVRFNYRFTPACLLSARFACPPADPFFTFETHAYSLAHALQHLRQACVVRGLDPALAAFRNGACWPMAEENPDEVILLDGSRHHALEWLPDPQS